MGIKIKGLNKALANYDKRSKAITVNSIVNKGAAIVQGKARSIAPVDTGALRRSIAIKMANGTVDATATVSTNLEYAPHQEFGTVNQKAQPFMHPAAQQSRSQVQNLAISEIKKAVKV